MKGKFTTKTIIPANAVTNLVTQPFSFSDGHVRQNYSFVHSCARNENCGSYASGRKYVYRIELPAMDRYDPPEARSKLLRLPIIFTSDPNIAVAKMVAFDPRKDQTEEVDLIFDIELEWLVKYKKLGQTAWIPIDWKSV